MCSSLYNTGHQNESLSPMTSGLMYSMYSHKADARSLLTHFNLDLKYSQCMQQQPMQDRGTGRNQTNIIWKEKSVEANVELRQGLDKIVRKLPAFGNRRTRSSEIAAMILSEIFM